MLHGHVSPTIRMFSCKSNVVPCLVGGGGGELEDYKTPPIS